MRIDRGSWASLGVTAALVAVAVAVAAVRARPAAVPGGDRAVAAEAAPPMPAAETAAAERLALGARLWAAECEACHSAAEVAPAAAALAALPDGRAALLAFLRDGRPRRPGEPPGPPDHPPFEELAEAELEAVVDHLLARAPAAAH